ncbi:hypothetical protein FNF27_05251 [Cafeteria roenbergensis]|nr:hypothetical protein FNF27_05251 [Cafeteria roenbergensis]
MSRSDMDAALAAAAGLRELVRSCHESHRVEAAVWFARKLVAMTHAGGSAPEVLEDDIYLLCDALVRAGEFSRAIFVMEQHGLGTG